MDKQTSTIKPSKGPNVTWEENIKVRIWYQRSCFGVASLDSKHGYPCRLQKSWNLFFYFFFQKQAEAKAGDLHQNGVTVELMHINRPGHPFDVNAFYKVGPGSSSQICNHVMIKLLYRKQHVAPCCHTASVLPLWNSRCKIELIFGVMLQFNVVWCIHSRREIVLTI